MKKVPAIMLAMALATPFTSVAHAADMVEKRFKTADSNNDGKITKEDAEKGMPRVAKNFDRIDTDKDGLISLEDIRKAMQK